MKLAKILFYNLTLLILFYVIIEILTGQAIFKKKLKCSYILCNADYSYKTDLYSPNLIEINYVKDAYGFRGRTKPISKIDILTIGGSTTDERYLNLPDTWSEQLELNFKGIDKNIDVVNAGIDGQSTFGHVWNFKNWFRKIDEFSVKYILFLIGFNEKEYAGRHDFNINKVRYPKKILYFLKYNDGIANKIYELLVHKYNPIDKLNVAHSKIRKQKYYFINKKDKFNFENLETNINELIKLTMETGAKPIFVTQGSLRWKKYNGEIYSISKSYDYYSREKKISDLVIKICEKNNAICINGFELINLDDKDTYDLVHTTPLGSKKIADVIFNGLKDLKFN